MYRISHHHHKKQLTRGAVALAMAASVYAQQQSFTQAGTSQPPPSLPLSEAAASAASGTNSAVPSSNPIEKFFSQDVPDVFARGKLNLNVRLRYEQMEDENIPGIIKDSYVATMRTRLGYTTAPLYGFQGMIEGVNTFVIGPEHNYNAAATDSQGKRPSVADVPLTRFDQVWLGYTSTNLVDFSAKVGQQQINLDNQRFIGDVSWRQNMQTYEAISAQVAPVKDLNLYYCYIWEVDRAYGDVSGLAAANQDFVSHSDLINISYAGWKYGRFVGYAYLLDLSNHAGNGNSCATYGGYFAGNAPVLENVMLDYRAEFARQDQYANNPARYGADYYNLEAGANIKPLAFGAGDEVLGSGANSGAGGGRVGFKTPLESPHPFNGWGEVFVTHPANGLQDVYGYAQVTLPEKIPIRFVYHKFNAAYGSGDYGQEFDICVSKDFGTHWSALLEFADYRGENKAPPVITATHVDVQTFWAAVEFKL